MPPSWTASAPVPPPPARAHRVARPRRRSPTSRRCCASCRCSPTSASRAACRLRDALIARALRRAARRSDGSELELLVLGMGKLGGGELNFSSDIDLVFLFPEHGETDGAAAARARGVLHASRPARGAAARHRHGRGLRLPRGPAAAAVRRLGAAGRELRRVRGLPAAARPRLGALCLRQGAPGHRRRAVRRAVPQRAAAVRVPPLPRLRRVRVAARDEGADRARGRAARAAGQRQARPGRHPRDRVHRAGVPADPRRRQSAAADAQPARRRCRCSRARSCCSATAVAELGESYRFLRRVENRLQERNDEQTHDLPQDEAGRARLALAMGAADWPTLDARDRAAPRAGERALSPRCCSARTSRSVGAMRCAALETLLEPEPDDARRLAVAARARDCATPAAVLERLDLLRESALLPAPRRDRPPPAADAAAARCCRRSRAATTRRSRSARVLHVIERIGGRTVYLALLNENAVARQRLVELCAHSQFLADQIAAFPLLLDELLDERLFESTPTRAEFAQDLRARMAGADADDPEQQVDLLRQFQRAAVFRVAVPDLTGRLPLMKVSDRLTDIAELIVARGARPVVAADRRRGTACRAAAPDDSALRDAGMIVVAYGKFGGIELGYGSDLDLVFLHDSAGEVQRTAGPAVVDNGVFFLRLVQRLVHLLTVHSAAGRLYEVDTRLRPSGKGGLLVQSIDGLRRLPAQRSVDLGAPGAAAGARRGRAARAARALRGAALRHPALRHPARHAARGRAQRCASACAPSCRGPGPAQFDLKQDAGGITDIEFLAQYWTLRWCRPLRGAGHLFGQHPAAREPGLDRPRAAGDRGRADRRLPRLSAAHAPPVAGGGRHRRAGSRVRRRARAGHRRSGARRWKDSRGLSPRDCPLPRLLPGECPL